MVYFFARYSNFSWFLAPATWCNTKKDAAPEENNLKEIVGRGLRLDGLANTEKQKKDKKKNNI